MSFRERGKKPGLCVLEAPAARPGMLMPEGGREGGRKGGREGGREGEEGREGGHDVIEGEGEETRVVAFRSSSSKTRKVDA